MKRCLEIKKELVYKRVDPKQCTIWPSLGHKSLQSLRQIQYWSSSSICCIKKIKPYLGLFVNGIDTFVREAMPIQEEEKASKKPAAKARPILKPSSASCWDCTLVEQKQWIDTETQESKDPYCFQVSKFITRLLRHSQKVYREDDGAVHYDQVVNECKEKQSDNTGYWSDEMKKHFVNASALVDRKIGISSGKKRRTKEKVSILLGSELSSSIPVRSSNPRRFRKYNQSCIARQCTVTRRFYRVYLSRRKRKRIEVNSESWFDSRRSQSHKQADKLCSSLL